MGIIGDATIHAISIAAGKGFDQRGHQHFAHGTRARDGELGDVGFQVRASRSITNDARAIDGQHAINGIHPVKFTIIAKDIATDLDRAITRGQRDVFGQGWPGTDP